MASKAFARAGDLPRRGSASLDGVFTDAGIGVRHGGFDLRLARDPECFEKVKCQHAGFRLFRFLGKPFNRDNWRLCPAVPGASVARWSATTRPGS